MIRTDRLRLLAEYLHSLPENYEHFDMTVYLCDVEDEIHNNECGSSACALGHSPFAKLPDLNIDDYVFLFDSGELVCVDWDKLSHDYYGVKGNSFEWKWMFSPMWTYIENTPKSAADRIIKLCDVIENGESFEELENNFHELVDYGLYDDELNWEWGN